MSDYIERQSAIELLADIEAAILDGEGFQYEEWEEYINSIESSAVKDVVLCKDCRWWHKSMNSAQGRCALLHIYPTEGWYCANGAKEGDRRKKVRMKGDRKET